MAGAGAPAEHENILRKLIEEVSCEESKQEDENTNESIA